MKHRVSKIYMCPCKIECQKQKGALSGLFYIIDTRMQYYVYRIDGSFESLDLEKVETVIIVLISDSVTKSKF